MADWFAVYRETDGELLSLGTVITDPLRPGNAKINLGPTRPEGGVWNPSTLVFDPTPARPPDVDRVDEFITAMPRNGGRFTEATIRAELTKLLGPNRFRGFEESRDLS